MNGQLKEAEKSIEYKRFYRFERFTVCFVKSDKKPGVGISRCSELDTYNKALGKEIAYGRAVRSLARDKRLKTHSALIG